jgi:hypothetical protein
MMTTPAKNSLRLIENVMHHDMERRIPLVPDMVQRIDVALINIKESVRRKLHRLMEPSAPLINGSIQLYDLSAWL